MKYVPRSSLFFSKYEFLINKLRNGIVRQVHVLGVLFSICQNIQIISKKIGIDQTEEGR